MSRSHGRGELCCRAPGRADGELAFCAEGPGFKFLAASADRQGKVPASSPGELLAAREDCVELALLTQRAVIAHGFQQLFANGASIPGGSLSPSTVCWGQTTREGCGSPAPLVTSWSHLAGHVGKGGANQLDCAPAGKGWPNCGSWTSNVRKCVGRSELAFQSPPAQGHMPRQSTAVEVPRGALHESGRKVTVQERVRPAPS